MPLNICIIRKKQKTFSGQNSGGIMVKALAVSSVASTVKPVLSNHSKIHKTKGFKIMVAK